MDNPFFLPQNDDFLPTVGVTAHFSYRYACARSADSRTYNDPAQDYLGFQTGEASFLFTLCDGVSQSFFGDLAARMLGNALMQWLISLPSAQEKAQLQNNLEQHLRRLSLEANEAVKNFALPASIPPLLREVLEEKRDKGSESTFIGGRIDLPSKNLPRGRFLTVWMGDSRLRIWRQNQEISQQLGGEFLTTQRWSSKHGIINGKPYVYFSPLFNEDNTPIISRWQIYSDGFSSLDNIQAVLSNDHIQELMIQSAHTPQSDDISYLEIWLGKTPENVLANGNPVSLESPTVLLNTSPADIETAKTVLGTFIPQPPAKNPDDMEEKS